MVSSFFFFVGKGGSRLLPSKIFKKIFSGRGVGWFLNGWGELVIRDLWSVRFWATIHL